MRYNNAICINQMLNFLFSFKVKSLSVFILFCLFFLSDREGGGIIFFYIFYIQVYWINIKEDQILYQIR